MADTWRGPVAGIRGLAELAQAIARARPGDTIDLDATAFGDWRICLADGQWSLAGAAGSLQFGTAGSARLRLRRHGFPHLLVGADGYPTIRAALDAAQGGETLLVAPGVYDEGESLAIDRSVTLQGVAHNGAAVTDCDAVAARIVARAGSGGAPAFRVPAPGVIVHGIALASTGAIESVTTDPGLCPVLEIQSGGFSLLASVVGCEADRPAGIAIQIAAGHARAARQHAFVSGCHIRGSIALKLDGNAPRELVALVGNQIEAGLLPAVCVCCDAHVIEAGDPAASLPVIEDNRVLARDGLDVAFALQWEDACEAFTPRSDALDLYFARLVHGNPQIGAVLVDAAGHMRSTPLPDYTDCRRAVHGLAVYASAESAMLEAGEGDTVYSGTGSPDAQRTDTRSPVRGDAGAVATVPVITADHGPAARELSSMEVLFVLRSGLDATVRVRLFNGAGRLKHICDSVQEAIEVADDGDRIVLPAGRHVTDVRIDRPLTLCGANVGRSAGSPRRGVETTLMGRVVVGRHATNVVIDGLTVVGSMQTEPAALPGQHFVLRNCVIDGRDGETAINVDGGTGSALTSNLVLGGRDEAIRIPHGFDDLAISGNRIHAAEGAVGIALSGGPGTDSVQIVGNTFVGGDYGVLLEVNQGLAQPGDVVTVAGNQFGEVLAGIPSGAPVIAAVHADGPVPASLEGSLGISLERNAYHVGAPGVGADVLFLAPRSTGRFA